MDETPAIADPYRFIQFYNTGSCSASSYFSQSSGNNISYAAWVSYIQSINDANVNPNVKLYIGLPAGTGASNSDSYVLTVPQAKTLATGLAKDFPHQFGGIMLWDATFSAQNTAYNGQSYAYNMKQILNSISGSTSTSTTTTSTTTSSSTTRVSLGENIGFIVLLISFQVYHDHDYVQHDHQRE